jgi:hypothetical protein
VTVTAPAATPTLPACAHCGRALPADGVNAATLRAGSAPGCPVVGWHLDCCGRDDAWQALREATAGRGAEVARVAFAALVGVVGERGRERVSAGPAWWRLVEGVGL